MKKNIIKIMNILIKYKLVAIFVALNLFNCILLSIKTTRILTYRSIIGNLIMLFILAILGLYIKQEKQKKYYLISTFVISILIIANSMYYTFYNTFISITLLKTSTQILDVSDAIADNVIDFESFMFLIIPISFLLVLKICKKKNIDFSNYQIEKKKIKNNFYAVGIVGLLFICTLSSTNVEKFMSIWNKNYIVNNYGLMIYQVNDIISYILPDDITGTKEAKILEEFKEYVSSNVKTTNEYTDIFKGKNVIMIHAESIQNLVLNQEFNGQELTPTLNKLVNEGIFFSNYYSPVSSGTSADAEFMINTSLLPSASGTAFMSYTDNEYVTLLSLLKESYNYNTFSMHANVGTFWNRDVMHPVLGYNNLYDIDYYDIDEVIGLGLSDKSFFNQSIDIIKQQLETKENIFTNLITLTNHTPFLELEKYGEFDLHYYDQSGNKFDYLENTKVGNYFKSVHYFDTALEEFLTNLDKENILEDSIIVLYGDHDNLYKNEEYNILYNYDFETNTILKEGEEGYYDYNNYEHILNKSVPFVIWSKDIEHVQIDTVMSSIDIANTLGNMLGVHNQFSLGNDVMNIDNNVVIYPDGSWQDNDYYYDSQIEYIYSKKSKEVDLGYVDNIIKLVNEKMILSNDILKYNLIKKVLEEK